MIVLLIYKRPQPEYRQGIRRRQQMELRRGDGPINHDFPEVPDIQIDWVSQEQALHSVAVTVNRVEDGRHPHNQLGHNTPEILHVPKEHKQRRQNQPNSQVEHNQTCHWINQQQEFPSEGDAVYGHKGKENQQRQPKIDQRGHILRKQEQILRHIYLGKDPRVPNQGSHPQIGRVSKIGKHQLSCKQVHHVVIHVIPEEIIEHHPHDEQVHQRGNYAPRHTKDRSFILFREVPLYQFAEQELMLF